VVGGAARPRLAEPAAGGPAALLAVSIRGSAGASAPVGVRGVRAGGPPRGVRAAPGRSASASPSRSARPAPAVRCGRPRRWAPLGVRAAGHRSPRPVAGRVLAMREESQEARGALVRAPCRRARVFRNTLGGGWPNWVGLGPVSGPNSTQFVNCAGSASVSAANPAQFANCPGSLSDSESYPGQFSLATASGPGPATGPSSLIAKTRPGGGAASGGRRRGRGVPARTLGAADAPAHGRRGARSGRPRAASRGATSGRCARRVQRRCRSPSATA
jgi:hypothetical protein